MITTETKSRALATIGEEISHELGAKMVKDFQDSNPNEINYYTIGRNIIDQILAQPECVGIRYYMALNEVGEKTLVYVGVDAKNQIITNYQVVDMDGKLSHNKGIVADRSIGTGKGGSSVVTETTSPYSSWL